MKIFSEYTNCVAILDKYVENNKHYIAWKYVMVNALFKKY